MGLAQQSCDVWYVSDEMDWCGLTLSTGDHETLVQEGRREYCLLKDVDTSNWTFDEQEHRCTPVRNQGNWILCVLKFQEKPRDPDGHQGRFQEWIIGQARQRSAVKAAGNVENNFGSDEAPPSIRKEREASGRSTAFVNTIQKQICGPSKELEVRRKNGWMGRTWSG